MRYLKQILPILLLSMIMMSFSQCKEDYKLQDKSPVKFGKVYYKDRVAGAVGGGSWINLFIPIKENPNNIVLDSVYFKGYKTKLKQVNDTLYIGHFETNINQPQDIIMSSEPLAEYGNTLPKIQQKAPFEIQPNECVVSYMEGKQFKYFKISNMVQKRDKLNDIPM